jgi:hypothetical protein
VGIIFLKKMFCDTKMRVEPNAQTRPKMLLAEMSDEQASMTPKVRGKRERYVAAEYETEKRMAYAKTVKRGDSACTLVCANRGGHGKYIRHTLMV